MTLLVESFYEWLSSEFRNALYTRVSNGRCTNLKQNFALHWCKTAQVGAGSIKKNIVPIA